MICFRAFQGIFSKIKGMQEYFTGKFELQSFFNQSIESIPCLIYPFFFSLREVITCFRIC